MTGDSLAPKHMYAGGVIKGMSAAGGAAAAAKRTGAPRQTKKRLVEQVRVAAAWAGPTALLYQACKGLGLRLHENGFAFAGQPHAANACSSSRCP